MINPYPHGIRTQLLTPLVLLIVFLMVLSANLFLQHETKSLEQTLLRKEILLKEKMQKEAAYISSNLVFVVEKALAQYDFSYIQAIITKNAKEAHDLVHIHLTDLKGKVLFSNRSELLGTVIILDNSLESRIFLQRDVHQQKTPLLETLQKISPDGEPWGFLSLGINYKTLNQEIQQSRREIDGTILEIRTFALALGVIFLIIGVVVLFVTVRMVTHPIIDLTLAVQAIDKDMTNIVLPTFKRDDEITVLGKAFQELINRIQAYLKKLKEINLSLEKKVRERTQKLFQQTEHLQRANTRIVDSINYAKNIQRSILPEDYDIHQVLKDNYFIIWQPKDIVGGDFYWLEQFPNGCLLAVGDCTGHGVPGALMSMAVYSALRKVVNKHNCHQPALLIQELNVNLRATLKQEKSGGSSNDGLDIALCFIRQDKSEIIFSGAKLDLICIQNSNYHHIKGDRQSIGYVRSKTTFIYKNHILKVDPEIVCYLTSDGLLDQRNDKTKLSFGRKRLETLILENHNTPFPQQKEAFLNAFHHHKGKADQLDDVTLFGFKVQMNREQLMFSI